MIRLHYTENFVKTTSLISFDNVVFFKFCSNIVALLPWSYNLLNHFCHNKSFLYVFKNLHKQVKIRRYYEHIIWFVDGSGNNSLLFRWYKTHSEKSLSSKTESCFEWLSMHIWLCGRTFETLKNISIVEK